jgi:hypothetical protein
MVSQVRRQSQSGVSYFRPSENLAGSM